MQDKQEPGWKLVWEGQPRLHGSGVRDSDEGAVGAAFWVSEGVRSLRECRSETRVGSTGDFLGVPVAKLPCSNDQPGVDPWSGN